MSGRIQTRVAVFAALAALAAVLIPAGLAAGSHTGGSQAAGSESYLRLRLGSQDNVTWRVGPTVVATQNITTRKNNCLAVSFAGSPQLLVVTPTGGLLGEVKDGLGVQSPGDGSGEPCGRVESDDGEQLSVALGAEMQGHLMTAIDVDLELKFNASVNVVFKHDGFPVATHDFPSPGGSDDGPDSGDGDNWRLQHRPLDVSGNQIYFDEVIFIPTAGALSLEGGADGTENGALDVDPDPETDPVIPPNNWSQFEIVPTFDGQIDCGDEPITVADGQASAQITRLENWDGSTCSPKLYMASASDEDNLIVFIPEGDQAAAYSATLTFGPDDGLTQPHGVLSYDGDDDGIFADMLFCDGDPFLGSTLNPAAFPSGETACIVEETTEFVEGGDKTLTTWDIVFLGDPKFSFG